MTEPIKIRVTSNNEAIKIGVIEGGSGSLPWYKGDYEVTPKTTEIVLPTKNKSMKEDVTVFQIPYREVTNPQGGLTVTIGLEDE